uniref:Polyprotein n=1 Tax=Anthurium amnicola TaxID=1678845 RepID=A0A1D1YEF4_9ARAE
MALTGFSWHSKFKLSNGAATHTDQTANRKLCSINIYSMVGLVCILFIIGCTFIATDHTEKIPRWGSISSIQTTASNKCQKQCMPPGSEALPRGIVTRTSDLEMQPLYGLPERKTNSGTLKSLLAIAVGIKQKESVDQIVTKFISNEFNVMLFHYDGVVDEWRDLPWCNGALHVSAINQTKWWFAKRFLHPDIVAEYSYIFLWDEDLGVENFDPRRYLSIIQEEGLEISQPALDIAKGPNFHHRITARQRRNKVHRRYYQFTGGLRCYENSTGPPCTGWVEMMAPVFSRAAWHCAWYMIQNDLVHSWGLDFKLGYCAQGERTKKVGIVDAEYIVHKAIPSLGGFDLYKVSSGLSSGNNGRLKVRTRSYAELDIFKQRWKNAVEEDECWTDLYPEIN